eukprot:5692410-Prymnesium_polylepis.2
MDVPVNCDWLMGDCSLHDQTVADSNENSACFVCCMLLHLQSFQPNPKPGMRSLARDTRCRCLLRTQ